MQRLHLWTFIDQKVGHYRPQSYSAKFVTDVSRPRDQETTGSGDENEGRVRVTGTHHLVEKTGNSGLECHTDCDLRGYNFSPLLSLSS